jgi:thymidylate kinase
MKHIIIEGTDRTGKDTLITSIKDHFKDHNITVRHFGKPKNPPNVTALEFQRICFRKEGTLLAVLSSFEEDVYSYFENVLIWNRSHIGEYVYGHMFRNEPLDKLLNFILIYEQTFINPRHTYYIQLEADPQFALDREDGNSFSQTLEEKKREMELFLEAYHFSSIDKKMLVKVDDGMGNFRNKNDIFDQIKDFI